MRIKKDFAPITITLENSDEADFLRDMCRKLIREKERSWFGWERSEIPKEDPYLTFASTIVRYL